MVRIRAWTELVLAILAALATLAALINPTWVEAVFEASPDAGSGEFEWLIAAGLLAITLCFSLLARRDLRRLRARAQPTES